MATRQRVETPSETIENASGLTAESAVRLMRIGESETREAPEDESEEDSLLQQMQALLSDAPNVAVRVKLYKLPKPGSGQTGYQWCEDFDPASFAALDWDQIRARWGAGRYQLRLIGPRGLVKAQQVDIAQPSSALAINNPAPSQGMSELAQVLAMLAEGQARMLEAVTQKPDPQASMRDTLQMVALVRDVLAPANAAPAGAQPNPMEMMREVFSMVREAKSAAKELADDAPAPADTDPLAMLPKLLDIAGAALKNQAAPLAQPQPLALPAVQLPPTIARAPFPATSETPQTAPAADESAAINPISQPVTQQEPATVNPAHILISIHINALCQMADNGIAPEVGADYILDNLPDDLLDHFDRADWFELISGVFPQIKAREAWMRAAKAEADKQMIEEPDETQTPQPPAPAA